MIVEIVLIRREPVFRSEIPSTDVVVSYEYPLTVVGHALLVLCRTVLYETKRFTQARRKLENLEECPKVFKEHHGCNTANRQPVGHSRFAVTVHQQEEWRCNKSSK